MNYFCNFQNVNMHEKNSLHFFSELKSASNLFGQLVQTPKILTSQLYEKDKGNKSKYLILHIPYSRLY